MSEYPPDDGSPSPPSQHGSETPQRDVSFEDSPSNAANNSIIGKVRSRVSSILPNRLSKWFSPSTKLQNDSLNGSLTGVNTSLPARRRRRLEVEEEDNYDEDMQRRGQYEDSRICSREEDNSEEFDEEDEDDESEEEYVAKQTRRDLNVEQRQPPAKRSRLNIDVRVSPLITRRQPLTSSTPAVGSSYLRNSSAPATIAVAPRTASYQRFTNLNLYAHQSKKEPAFNFGGQQNEPTSTAKINTDIIDLISNPPDEIQRKLSHENVEGGGRTGMSSRKSLNIPSSSTTLTGVDRVYAGVGQLKRQPLSSARTDPSTSLTVGMPPRRTSTTIHEVIDFEEQQYPEEQDDEVTETTNTNSAYNGRRMEETNNSYAANKRQKLINGSSNINTSEIPESNEEAILIDSASESGESTNTDVRKSNTTQQQHQRKTGLFNMSATGTAANTRNSSRTSSFGNGLNFYSHLEGRKSLFSGQNHGNALNNSTLSLTSLNRRQFNASIYGSTSALSDSRLLNTFSPFYKGKTTYGGAAAYNKYTAGAGASAVRITPTLIRPTSSLSTLSSSNNSLANNALSQQLGDNSAMSSTTKRILDLINDFATPLSEAKKMASNLKTNPNLIIPQHAKGRLNESDLNASRAMRLSQVRTPYTRPAVILQPSGNANGRNVGAGGGPLPPVKELQVPTMSQLLQMKKMQNTTEKARKITTTQNTKKVTSTTNTAAGMAEYTLPEVTAKSSRGGGTSTKASDDVLQRHTNKIKTKVTNSLRPSQASKDLKDEEPPPPVNLPNIAFPLMQSVPKIDIQLNKTAAPAAAFSLSNSPGTTKTTKLSDKTESNKTTTTFAFKIQSSIPTPFSSSTQTATPPTTDCNKASALAASLTTNTKHIFKFSEPLQIKGLKTSPHSVHKTATINLNHYKFSPPLEVTFSSSSTAMVSQNITQPQQPQFKTGSCLDVLSKPFSFATTSKTNTTTATTIPTTPLTSSSSGFGNQFKMSSNEWECNACMIRNKSELQKCVACETPRKSATAAAAPVSTTSQLTEIPSSFGQQFKKSSAEWECDTCMIRNKQEITKCVACETPRKGAAPSPAPAALPPIKNSFGDAFKPKSNTWECQTCMINNKNDANECVACQTKKPGATNSTNSAAAAPPATATQFKFGFPAAGLSNTTATASTAADAGFKTLAAQQKASKWECDACMTRNDANRTKCACCEQPKPGSTNVESDSLTASTKFTFGATAAAKFSFGFGPAANAPNEEELKKQLNKTNEELKPALKFAANTAPAGSFQFGIKPIVATDNKKDETDANKTSIAAGFKFGVTSDIVKKPDTTTTAATTGFALNSKPLTTTSSTSTTESSFKTSTTTTTAAVNSPSVKFSLPTTTTTTTSSQDKPTGVAAPTFSFGTTNMAAASTTSGGFAFGDKKTETKTASATTEEKKSLDNFAFKAPAAVSATNAQSSGFVFGSQAAIKGSTTTAVSSSNNTTTVSSVTTAAVKPMFSFGSSTASTASSAAAASVPSTTPAFGGFSFGSNTTTTASIPATGNTLFGAVTSTSTTTTAAKITSLSTTSTTTPASTNIFGSFGVGGGGGGGGGGLTNAASATPTFGSSQNHPPANNSTTVSSSTNSSSIANTTQFGAFGAKPATTSNVFGSFSGGGSGSGVGGGNKTTAETKPTLPVFGNVASSSTSQSSSNSNSFVFGSTNAASTATTAQAAGGATPGSVTSTSAAWPKNSFVFGTSAASTTSTSSAASASNNANENKELAKSSVFGTFGNPNAATNSANQQQSTSIFGAPTASNTSAPPPAFGTVVGSTGSSNSSTNLFGTNSAPAATNIFGANSSGAAATPAPAFGSSPFGGSASSTSATPTFGSTAASGGTTTFGGFGAAAASSSSSPSSNTTTNSTVEVKKPEAAFNFGAAPASQSTSGGFNFGSSSSTTKPAFNFGGSTATPQQPTFNFTGSTTESQNSTKPFQFGASPPSAPVFNFSRGASESTPNAPFQFNAGAAPVTSNIFAPAPTPGAQTAQQAKRKIRAPIRRVTQR